MNLKPANKDSLETNSLKDLDRVKNHPDKINLTFQCNIFTASSRVATLLGLPMAAGPGEDLTLMPA